MNKIEKIILNIPHSSTYIPLWDTSFINDDEKNETLSKITDFYTDDLFNVEDISNRIDRFVFRYSRVFCDVERFKDDDIEPMAKKGMGWYYTKGVNGVIFRDHINQFKDDIEQEYDLYHKSIKNAIKFYNKHNIKPLIIDCHSFGDEVGFPDICIGYNEQYGYNREVVEFLRDEFTRLGFKVEFNYPFSGSLYYEDLNHDTVMIEVNKKLYLNSDNTKVVDYYKIKYMLSRVINKL